MTPTPVVVTNSPSAAPRPTTLVSPVTMRMPARSASAAIEATIRRNSAISVPSSMMNAADSQRGRAPPTARSLTVPHTASVPISPPGNSSGVTTKLSVVSASRAPGSARAASVSRA
jgi:hypothetical protein